MKNIRVVAAIIINKDKVFATQRGYGEFKDGWEFPGGKIEKGETPEQALEREIQEELGISLENNEITYIGSYTRVKILLMFGWFKRQCRMRK